MRGLLQREHPWEGVKQEGEAYFLEHRKASPTGKRPGRVAGARRAGLAAGLMTPGTSPGHCTEKACTSGAQPE